MDFDSDQDLDLAMVTDGAIQVLAGDGSGTFTPVRSIPFRYRSGDLLAFDLDGNGLVDFAAALFDSEALAMYLQTSPGVMVQRSRTGASCHANPSGQEWAYRFEPWIRVRSGS